ncbi:MAG TPA: hypothetical protein PKX94_08060, partial [Opitutales bacterium]|nr:hypothetical protein [Opitutales bacterium]
MHIEAIGVTESNTANNQGRDIDADSIELPGPNLDSATDYDLITTSLTISPYRRAYEWGEYVDLLYTFENLGSTMSHPFSYCIYLSTDPYFSSDDYVFPTRGNRQIEAYGSDSTAFHTFLPSEAESGLASGSLYLGIAIDPYGDSDDQKPSNNQGRGLGVDYVQINIVPPPPLGDTPEPQIGSLTLSTDELIRGQRITLTALDVLDDINAVYIVDFALDCNGNGTWDDGDLLLGSGSKDKTVFTLDVRSDSRWATGDLNILARAKDNFGLLSDVAAIPLTVLGSYWGPIVPDEYEDNNSLENAYRMGGPGIYNIPWLSLDANDDDFYAFDVIGDDASGEFTISFFQDDMAPGMPEGDLDLELYWFDGSEFKLVEGSYASQTGQTSESITRNSMPSGRYVLWVHGDPHGDYSLDVEITNPQNAPQSGPLLLNEDSCTQ